MLNPNVSCPRNNVKAKYDPPKEVYEPCKFTVIFLVNRIFVTLKTFV
jgi:hypothetical protein